MDDWVVFQDQQYDDIKEPWVPNNYYTDILYFLLLKMKDDDQIEFFRKNIEDIEYEEVCFDHIGYIVLECFLNWPYQDYFMKSAELMWEFLADYEYSALLLKICNKIESLNGKNIKHGWEEKSYDYRGLLMEFWCKSAEHYKRYVFSEEIDCTLFLSKLLSLKKFTNEDGRNIGIILVSATDIKKEDTIAFKILRNIYLVLIKEEKWEILDWFMPNCFSSNEQASEFKRKLIFTKEAQRACHYFVKNGKWSAAESFIKWVSLSEEDLEKLKKRMIYSEDGRKACLGLIQYRKSVENVESFIRWHFSFVEEIKAFKKELIFSDGAVYKCANLVKEDKLDRLNEFIHLCLSSDKEITELKKNIAYKAGGLVLEKLISDYSIEENYDEQGMISHTITFDGGKWEEVEKFLTWCFLSEEDINEFKKNVLLEMSGVKIHFNLIKSNRWQEAETFFAWLGLSFEEIIKLKKETLFDYVAASDMFSELMYSEEDDNTFVPYGGSKQEAIELLLRWYLTDKETILEFKDKFKHQHQQDATEKREAVFENFDFAIAQCLQDLNKEKTRVKRKSETFSPNKRICNFKLYNKEEEYGK